MTNIIFTAFSNRTDALELASEAVLGLGDLGIQSSTHFLDQRDAPHIDASTLVVSLGGDGTFLRAARLAHEHDAMVLPVNLGTMGFLLDVPSDQIVASVKESLNSARVVERLALAISVEGSSASEFALNDVVIERQRVGHMVRVRTYVGDDEYLTYSADGVLVSTPTGSTGYNFSAGGPVVDASLSVMIITPIAPHFTIDRSIVVDADKTVRLVAHKKMAAVVADGTEIGVLEPGQTVLVQKSPTPVKVVSSGAFELGVRLRQSLREGHA
ncbi:MAG: NAD(+)/NADH kinase [Acidimicrobiaceae bacterium]|nr:NAD(+)/NADH kinase [Acidimicrobiaceae bacterium]